MSKSNETCNAWLMFETANDEEMFSTNIDDMFSEDLNNRLDDEYIVREEYFNAMDTLNTKE